jgi:hypothetical protein
MMSRKECPVLTCSRTMQSSEEICAHCWQHVPADIRRSINKEPVHSRRRADLMVLAVSAAQVAV